MENELNKHEGCGCGHNHEEHGCGDNCDVEQRIRTFCC